MKQRLRLESELHRERDVLEALDEEVQRLQESVRQKEILKLAAAGGSGSDTRRKVGANFKSEMVGGKNF